MDQLLEVTKHIEKQVDAAIEQIDNLDANDLENIRRNRVKEMKDRDLKRKEWLANGHGSYDELPEEKSFFDAIKRSERVVLHFYTNTNERSRIVDMHFKALAPRHIETLFAKLNAEKCPFLAERLKIKMIPSIVCVRNGTMVDKLVGFTTLGNRDDFSTEDMEWRLAQNEIIEYEGDLSVPPSEQKTKPEKNRKIRNGIFNGHDDDLDVEDVTNTTTAKMASAYELSAEEAAELGLDEGSCGIGGLCTAPDVCECQPGFERSARGICEYHCDGGCDGGDCIGPNKCSCRMGYVERNGVCEPQCAGGCMNGICTGPNQCTCKTGWILDKTKTSCIAHCDDPCLNGDCTGPNQCTCKAGYIQDTFKASRCVAHCPGGCENGVCSAPNFCICNNGYVKQGKGSNRCIKRQRRLAIHYELIPKQLDI